MALAAKTAVKDSRKLHSNGDDDGATPFEVTHEEEPTVQQINRDRTPRSRFPRRKLPTPQKGSPTGHEEPQCHRCGGINTIPQGADSETMIVTTVKGKGTWQLYVAKRSKLTKHRTQSKTKRVEVVPSRQEDQEYTMYHVSGQGSTKPLIADVTWHLHSDGDRHRSIRFAHGRGTFQAIERERSNPTTVERETVHVHW